MLVNATPFPAQDVPHVDKDGQEVVIGIVQATFEIEPNRRRVELVSRGCFPLGRTNLLRELRIDLHR